ncbi:hypothetical protein BGW38_000657 [Lunasporangiospora selenospora]|uniref:IgA peptidase M64-domain-containing protein n=1 Tax=Lunasporangiospora selenospora TaxID=979761 RepID=A0A9P6KIH8_9FUNG|nr:hypothetical protein BGW38_000657 [Lunasporangiospora selenospora]
MRVCLFLSSAIAIASCSLSLAQAYPPAANSYVEPNDEYFHTGSLLLLERTVKSSGVRYCKVLNQGESQPFRNLFPLSPSGDRYQVLYRQSHEEHAHHHHGASGWSHLDEEQNGPNAELLELNANLAAGWKDISNAFLAKECDQVEYDQDLDDEEPRTAEENEQGSNQVVFRTPGRHRNHQNHGRPKQEALGLQVDDEVRKLVDSGPDKNRVDIVFMGDGYTLEERDKFFKDMKRLVNDMFVGDTFQSFLPLYNVHALFRPSKESGIGTNGKWKDTSFRLYRDGTELRGIYVANPRAARQACQAVGRYSCDFPSLIGNDPYYGGLGGEFVISTSSNKSGTVVLRHELGHSLINVGEEYDGGQVYSGVNAERWSIQNVKWKHWLTDKVPREEKNVLRVQDYAWYDLKQGPYKIPFKSDGQFKRWSLKISHSGVDTDDSFEAYIDGKRLDWTSPGDYDRDFFEWTGDKGFTKGDHVLEFRQGAKYDHKDDPEDPARPIRQLCSVTLHEFMGEDQYRFDNNVISLYPTFDLHMRKTWRSNHEYCLMRNMASTQLCSVCKEGLWLRMLSKISLLDELQIECHRGEGKKDKHELTSYGVEAKLIPLGQYREDQSKRLGKEERYEIQWFKSGEHFSEWDGQNKVSIPVSEEGLWQVKIEYKTPEVRQDMRGLLKASKIFALNKYYCPN